jgi:hypothetical protein
VGVGQHGNRYILPYYTSDPNAYCPSTPTLSFVNSGHVPESESASLANSTQTTSAVSLIESTMTTEVLHVYPSNAPSSEQEAIQDTNYGDLSAYIFQQDGQRSNIKFNPPQPDSRLIDTTQLAFCLNLLEATHGSVEIVDKDAREWLNLVKNEPDEHDRLKTLATDVIRAFKRDELKDAKAVTEVMYLAPVLEKDDFRYLLKEFFSGIENSALLDIHQLEGLAELIQGADTSYLDPADLVKILELLSTRLQGAHQQSVSQLCQLTHAVSLVLDAMADADVKELDRESVHEPLLVYLKGLKRARIHTWCIKQHTPTKLSSVFLTMNHSGRPLVDAQER